MKEKLIQEISNAMTEILSVEQIAQLNGVLLQVVSKYTITQDEEKAQHEETATNDRLLEIFLSAKQVEGCTTPTIKYYGSTIRQLFKIMPKKAINYTTEDIRAYLAVFQRKHKSSKVTIDNIRRIFSSFFGWLEEEDYIIKSPVRRIHKVKTGTQVKEVLTDENLEHLRDNCKQIRDLAIIDLLASTGITGRISTSMSVNVSYLARETKKGLFISMPVPKFISSNISLHVKTATRHFLFHWLNRITALKYREWKPVCGKSGERQRLSVCILINSEGHSQRWQSIRECLLSRYNACLGMSRLTRPCIMLWSIKQM